MPEARLVVTVIIMLLAIPVFTVFYQVSFGAFITAPYNQSLCSSSLICYGPSPGETQGAFVELCFSDSCTTEETVSFIRSGASHYSFPSGCCMNLTLEAEIL